MKDIIFFLIFLFIFSCKQPHICKYELCPFKGQTKFNGNVHCCEADSECRQLDKNHFNHPNWTYDQCFQEFLNYSY